MLNGTEEKVGAEFFPLFLPFFFFPSRLHADQRSRGSPSLEPFFSLPAIGGRPRKKMKEVDGPAPRRLAPFSSPLIPLRDRIGRCLAFLSPREAVGQPGEKRVNEDRPLLYFLFFILFHLWVHHASSPFFLRPAARGAARRRRVPPLFYLSFPTPSPFFFFLSRSVGTKKEKENRTHGFSPSPPLCRSVAFFSHLVVGREVREGEIRADVPPCFFPFDFFTTNPTFFLRFSLSSTGPS